jgi:hypothetical protein
MSFRKFVEPKIAGKNCAFIAFFSNLDLEKKEETQITE